MSAELGIGCKEAVTITSISGSPFPIQLAKSLDLVGPYINNRLLRSSKFAGH